MKNEIENDSIMNCSKPTKSAWMFSYLPLTSAELTRFSIKYAKLIPAVHGEKALTVGKLIARLFTFPLTEPFPLSASVNHAFWPFRTDAQFISLIYTPKHPNSFSRARAWSSQCSAHSNSVFSQNRCLDKSLLEWQIFRIDLENCHWPWQDRRSFQMRSFNKGKPSDPI